jgi:asparagine synthase (glutamine-hydrolysing)
LGQALSGLPDRPNEVGDLVRGTILGRNMLRDLRSTHLPALLRYEDRNSMAFGIEARVPFLDHRLVEAALLLPDRLKVSGREQKVALRRAMKGIVPDVVLDRRDKVAFASPEARWLGDSRRALTHLGVRPAAEDLGILRPGTVAWAIAGLGETTPTSPVRWRVLSLELWLRLGIKGERGLLAV